MTETPKGRHGVTGWHKSSYSSNTGTCVEQGVHPTGQVAVRDTKLGEDSHILTFEASDWKAFIATL
ncbi:DUF397 domain-containing protein [Streptomyces sp. 5-10]|nr:DUF397 domain-containing protein [Streptomyces sp. 5-10]